MIFLHFIVVKALQVYLHSSCFRSLATLSQSDIHAGLLSSSQERFREILCLSIAETNCGGLGVLESVEQRFATLWDAFTALHNSNGSTGSGGGNNGGSNNATSGSDLRANYLAATQSPISSFTSAISSLTAAAASSRLDASAAAASMSLLASLGATPIGIDPATARRHMMEMGFPKEWCDVALRRTRYNVEAAINLCFEHGTDMDQLVAEDAALMSAQSSGGRTAISRRVVGEHPEFIRLDSSGGIVSSSSGLAPPNSAIAAALGFGSSGRLQSRSSSRTSSHESSMKQLVEMGFPSGWAAKALEMNNNHVDAALTWILSHGEELVNEEDVEQTGETDSNNPDERNAEKTASNTAATEETPKGPNPLTVVSGVASISSDLLCSMPGTNGFPSIGCRGFAATTGKWYFEVILHTAGCIQIGWVDSAYEGNAEGGEGVGDDAHSWAFDGWRVYLWHEVLSDWGTKWSPGDVVGCAIDIDSKLMSFYLNGHGEEIGMGPAFEGFVHYGGLYPCASFNRNERIQFNFGHTPFKYAPPPGYSPFNDHVLSLFESSAEICHDLNFDDMITLVRGRQSDGQISGDDSGGQGVIEDAMEEQRGEADFLWQRRYFQPDESRASSASALRMPQAQLPPFPSTKKELLSQIKYVGFDLCILYCRMIILRVLEAYPKMSKDKSNSIELLKNVKNNHSLIELIISSSREFKATTLSERKEEMENTVGENLLLLVRLCSSSSSRTKIFLQTMSILPSPVIPANIGALICVGGAPMLYSLQLSMATLLKHLRANDDTSFVESMIRQITLDTYVSSRREYVAEWKLENGFAPSIFKEGLLTDSGSMAQPSLNLALWMTLILIDQFAKEISQIPSSDNVEKIDETWTVIGKWLIELCRSWSLALRAPSMAVKLCSMRVLLTLFQEVSVTGARLVGAPLPLVSAMLSAVSLDRLSQLAIKRIAQEKGSVPVCSEYLQILLELVVCCRRLQAELSRVDEIKRKQNLGSNVVSPANETMGGRELPESSELNDETVPDVNWEALSGMIMSNDGWDSWTGSVSHHVAGWGNRPTQVEKQQEVPPELFPGACVMRVNEICTNVSTATAEDSDNTATNPSSNETESDNAWGPEPAVSPADSFPPPTLLPRSRIPQKPRRGSTEQDAEDVRYGTVVRITAWPGCGPGTARTIRWDDTNIEEDIRWGAQGQYDVTHVIRSKSGKVTMRYPKPASPELKCVRNGFGLSRTFGVILRIRKDKLRDSDGNDIKGRFDGVMEWPDFNAIVYVRGVKWTDGNWTIQEDKLLSGSDHAGWSVRFASSSWRPGTTYELSALKTSCDTTSGRGAILSGQFNYKVTVGGSQTVLVSGDIRLQKSSLFHFDEKACSTSITISRDKLAASCTNPDGRPCVYGNIGFSSGIHYWEFKIDQTDSGSVFIGAAEKPPVATSPPGNTFRFTRWQGQGMINSRLSYRAPAGNGTGSGTERYYGDHFHTGDTVGVLLDMNRGRLSFFLDGMKYGEHTLLDLGEAFDGLTGTSIKVRPKTYYPIVGFRKVNDRSGDRIALTSRYMTCIGTISSQVYRVVDHAWGLLSAWCVDKPATTGPVTLKKEEWLYHEAWRDWLTWRTGRFIRVKTRCKSHNMMVLLDTSPRACVEASIRLGLPMGLFRGDRIYFTKSCGRALGTKEEAVILGAYDGLLWYRLDAQKGDVSLQDGSSPAWCLAVHDVESFVIGSRSSSSGSLPSEVANIELPRIPTYHGGCLRVVYENGAVIRDGLEIDTSEIIGTAELNEIVFAVERRINSSNIARYRIVRNGKFGWISENIRGGSEEAMVVRIPAEDAVSFAAARREALSAAKTESISFRIIWNDVSSLDQAMTAWEESIPPTYSSQLDPGGILSHEGGYRGKPCTEPFSDYVTLVSSMDDGGCKPWTVESDMQLVELISRVSARDGISPYNLPCHLFEEAITAMELSPSSLLKGLGMRRALARASLLRVANQVIGHALPYLNTVLPEEKLRLDRLGSVDGIDVLSTTFQPPPPHFVPEESVLSLQENRTLWNPPCSARRLRSLRRLLFNHTKRVFWESVLDSTTTPTALQQDEYDDPKEIKVIKINRIQATHAKLAQITSSIERFKLSVFGQLHKEMRSFPPSAYRRAFLGRGHGGQKRAFKVKFYGEGVNDYGGPYRAVFEQVVDELQSDSAVNRGPGSKPSEKCLLPLLSPCPNRIAGVGSNQDKLVLSSTMMSPLSHEYMQYFGRLVGTAVRHNLHLGLDLTSLLWRPLVRLTVSRGHLEAIDLLSVTALKSMEELALSLEQDPSQNYGPNYVPPEWAELNFSVTSSDGTQRIALVSNGEEKAVTLGNWRDYVVLVERVRLREGINLYKVFRDGLVSVLPADLLPLFTAGEMEVLVSGNSSLDLKLLKQCTEYEDISPDGELVKNFWEILEEMTDEERTLFLRFVWARSRMPASAQEFPLNFKLQSAQGGATEHPDSYLPHAQTCFFSLSLPNYSTKEIQREKLLYAINNSPNMDADVRLHNAEGWDNS